MADRLAHDLFVFLDLESDRGLNLPDFVTEHSVRILAQEELSHDLGLDWDNLEGTTKLVKAQHIVITMIRQKQIARLLSDNYRP